jgi:hypothetical protein
MEVEEYYKELSRCMQHAPLPQPVVFVLALQSLGPHGTIELLLGGAAGFRLLPARVGELVGLNILARSPPAGRGAADSHLPANMLGGIDLPQSN